MAEHYLAPPGECYRLALPPAGVRASRAVVRLARARGAGPSDPVVDALRDGPLRLSTLAARLEAIPRRASRGCGATGIVAVEQDLRRARVPAGALRGARRSRAASPEGQGPGRGARAAARGRRAHAGRRTSSRDRSSLRGALERLVDAGAVRIDEERADRGPRAPGDGSAPRA